MEILKMFGIMLAVTSGFLAVCLVIGMVTITAMKIGDRHGAMFGLVFAAIGYAVVLTGIGMLINLTTALG